MDLLSVSTYASKAYSSLDVARGADGGTPLMYRRRMARCMHARVARGWRCGKPSASRGHDSSPLLFQMESRRVRRSIARQQGQHQRGTERWHYSAHDLSAAREPCRGGSAHRRQGGSRRPSLKEHLAALDYACREGHASIVSALLRAKAPKEERVDDELQGTRPVHWAANAGHAAVLDALLDAGASADVLRDDSSSALHYACMAGHVECVRSLLLHGANANLRRQADGAPPLHLAAQQGNSAVVQALLDAGADVDAYVTNRVSGAQAKLGSTQTALRARRSRRLATQGVFRRHRAAAAAGRGGCQCTRRAFSKRSPDRARG